MPPTEAALMQHTRRAVFQAGYVWSQWNEKTPTLPNPEHWGWRKSSSESYEPVWTEMPAASKSWKEFVKCVCKALCTFN